jgi:hypothetical protein
MAEAHMQELLVDERALMACIDCLGAELGIEREAGGVVGVTTCLVEVQMREHFGAVRALLAQVDVFKKAVGTLKMDMDTRAVCARCDAISGPVTLVPCFKCKKTDVATLCPSCVQDRRDMVECTHCCPGPFIGCGFCGYFVTVDCNTHPCNRCGDMRFVCKWCHRFTANYEVPLTCRSCRK